MSFRARVSRNLSSFAAISAALFFSAATPANPPDAIGSGFVATFQQAVRVWVNSSSGVYHCPGSRYYGATKRGAYMTEVDARAKGNRPAYGQTCGTLPRGGGTPVPLGDRPGKASGPQVWVNTSSGVYHCPGTRYYQNTTRGQLMTESEARASGKRPAYGKPCT